MIIPHIQGIIKSEIGAICNDMGDFILQKEYCKISFPEVKMKANADFPRINKKRPEGLNPSGIPYRVLIIDDSMFVRKQISQILTSQGFEIAGEAGDGLEGIEKYKELSSRVDLVTLDISMPRMDGITTLESILKLILKQKSL